MFVEQKNEILDIIVDSVANTDRGMAFDAVNKIEAYLESINEWVSVEDRLPEELKMFEYVEYFVYADSCVESYAIDFKGGKFVRGILDHDGDVMDYEDVENVSHWMIKVDPQPPKSEEGA
jgi:hypothetical protein